MKKEGSRFLSLLPLVVFALFALCLMGVLLTGAGVYQRISQASQDRSQSRTAALYLSTRVRQAEDVRIEEFGLCDALAFPQIIDGTEYVTLVYCQDGWLKELFCVAGAGLSPEDGEKLLELPDLEMTLEESVLTLNTGDQTMTFTLPAGRRAPA